MLLGAEGIRRKTFRPCRAAASLTGDPEPEELSAMAISLIEQQNRLANPLDMVEQVVTSRSWPCDRVAEDELSLVVETSWSDLQLSITWCADLESLQLACALEMKVPPARRLQVHSLLALIN